MTILKTLLRSGGKIVCCSVFALAACAHMNYEDRARTPLKPMISVVRAQSNTFDSPPRVLEGNRPEYPEPEGDRRQKGFVSLICTIDAHGRLTDLEIETATGPTFAYEAARAVAKWKFAPAMKNGHPVAGKLRVPMHFNALGIGESNPAVVHFSIDAERSTESSGHHTREIDAAPEMQFIVKP